MSKTLGRIVRRVILPRVQSISETYREELEGKREAPGLSAEGF